MKANIFGIPVDIKTNKEIQESGAVLVAVRVAEMLPMEMYPAGTMGGFACHICGQECILAPSSQEIILAGKNPIQCMNCTIRLAEDEKSGKGDN